MTPVVLLALVAVPVLALERGDRIVIDLRLRVPVWRVRLTPAPRAWPIGAWAYGAIAGAIADGALDPSEPTAAARALAAVMRTPVAGGHTVRAGLSPRPARPRRPAGA